MYLALRKCLSLKLNFHQRWAKLFWSSSRGSITSNFCDGLSPLLVLHTSWPEKPKALVCMRANACMSWGARARYGLSLSRRRSKRRKLTFILGRRVNFLASGLRGDRRFDFHATNFQAQHSGCSQVGSDHGRPAIGEKSAGVRVFKWFQIKL